MKDLTLSRLAGAGLRANPRAYRSLAAGIFLSIFLVSFMCLCVHGAALALWKKQVDRLGAEDAILYDCPMTDADLVATGWFDTIAHVGVTGTVMGEAQCLGWYDEDAARLLRPRLLAGRLPEEPGELAAEKSALEALEIAAELGDGIELTVTPIDGAPETRVYTLVGLLPAQAALMDRSANYLSVSEDGTPALMRMPSLIVSAEDAPFATGRVVLQRALTLRPGRSVRALLRSLDQIFTDEFSIYDGRLSGVARFTGALIDPWTMDDTPFSTPQVLCALLLGGALVLASCVGVAGAMESRLAARVEEIGMLRAVGATRRQVRRVFGREAWLLAALTAPAALAFACLLAFLGARLFPEMFVFRPTPALLAPIFVLSMAAILLAAHLPLRRAARTMPMQVLRDARLIRRMRGRGSRKDFSPALLIALRQTFLHPGRLAAPALFTAATMFVAFLTLAASASLRPKMDPGFYLSGGGGAFSRAYYVYVPERTLSEGDIAQLRALPKVKKASVSYFAQAALPLDRAAEYFLSSGEEPSFFSQGWILEMENGWPGDDMDPFLAWEAREQWAVQQTLGTEKKVVSIRLEIVETIPEEWTRFVTDGRIDKKAVDSGEQVLVYAPDMYVARDRDGVALAPYPVNSRYTLERENDYFHAGQELAFTQLLSHELNGLLKPQPDDPQELLDTYASLERRDAAASVGAVLGGSVPLVWEPCIITTEKGARALGLDLSCVTNIELELRSTPTLEEEEALERRVAAIAARGGMTVMNLMAAYRENVVLSRVYTLTLLSVTLVLFAAAVGLVSGGVKRRIVAQTRAIGTLRAVGASEKVLRRCFGGQAGLALLCGAALGAAVIAALCLAPDIYFMVSWPLVAAGEAAFLLAAWFACERILRRTLRAVLRRSVIENIQEL